MRTTLAPPIRPRLVSATPGRLRLRLEPWPAPLDLAALSAHLRRLPVVREVATYWRTGNLVIHYQGTDPWVVLRALETALTGEETGSPPPALPRYALAERVPPGDLLRVAAGGLALLFLGLRRLRRPTAPLLGPRLQLATALLTLVTGYPFFRGGLRTLLGRAALDTDALISVATIASVALRENIVALVVLWLLNIGETLQGLVLRRTRRAIAALVSVGEPEVWVEVEGVEVRVPLGQVQPGDLVVVYPHQKIPVDGVVIAGSAAVNQAPITGESLPVDKNPGDWVYAGTLVEAGTLRIRAERVGQETTLARLIQRIEEAAASKAPIELVGQRFARRFVPLSFILAGGVFLATRDVRRSMTMLVIACPCAAGLATPTAISAAIGSAARYGVLIKGGTHLEMAGYITTVIFDKTGTLTVGRPQVSDVVTLRPEIDPVTLLQLAASAEIHCQHPLAEAVVRYAQAQAIFIPPHEECEIIVAFGVRADVDGHRLLVGNADLLQRFGLAIPPAAQAQAAAFAARGQTALYVARDDEVLGLIAISDTIRPEAPAAVRRLRAVGVRRIIMLTGDIPEAAAAVATHLGLTEYRARMLPEAKLEFIRALQQAGERVAMVGDGVNDAPALAQADLGIAMGTAGSDVAIEAADIALAGNDLRQIADIIQLGRQTLRIIRQNYGLAIGVNAGGLLASAVGRLSPVLAAVLHNASSLAVVLNSARLVGYRLDPTRALPPRA